MTFKEWQRIQDPDSCPFRPGAGVSGDSFGFRKDSLGSPIHLGVDRSGRPSEIQSPFDGTMTWKLLDPKSDWGSVLCLVDQYQFGQLHVAHAEHAPLGRLPVVEIVDRVVSRGETLMVFAGNIGLSYGAHTHAELVFPYSESLHFELSHIGGQRLIVNQMLNSNYLEAWVDQYPSLKGDAPFDKLERKIMTQARQWGIRELYEHFAIRESLPVHRRFGGISGPVIIVDTMWALQI